MGVVVMLTRRLRELRDNKGFLQSDIAERLNITQVAYSMYETGKRQMNYETLCLLADFFEVSTDYLLGRQDAIPSFLDEEERSIIAQYRALGEHSKDAVKNSLAFEYSRSPKTENTRKSAM
jgi:transcriptional regulator with XRE-family HTH domain